MSREHKRITYVASGAIVLILIVLATANAHAIKNQLNSWKLLPQPEKLTELYFTKPNSLPTTYIPGASQQIQFTVHNLEYQTTDYHFLITEQNFSGGTIITLSKGSFTLKQNQYKSDNSYISSVDLGSKIKLSIILQKQNETIDYLLNRASS